jgi:uncharacterized protein Yka (UPF0111/DUF47 family)
MGIKSLFKKYVLPEQIDFEQALLCQSEITHAVVNDFYNCFIHLNEKSCESILNDQYKANALKDKNMHDLLNAFITPIDRESIYRAVTGLNWIVLSIRHFIYETKAYHVNDLNAYEKLLALILEASDTLREGLEALEKGEQKMIAVQAEKIRLLYDEVVKSYVFEMAKLSREDDFQKLFIHKEILTQLREIGKRIYIMGNTLQDIVVKMN